ncbi:AMP-binding protein [Streptomyces sp. NPDC050418]|uniref:AMP-binding protein n=1 Tax=Streptomyces sp. NPDC050418 TaxID=3365612 RepID=UPI003797F43D
MTNLATALVAAAERYPQRTAVRAGELGLTWAELDDLTARVAGGLFAHGVRAGDPVGLRVPDVPAFPVLHFGVLRAGAVVVPLTPGPVTARLQLLFSTPEETRDPEGAEPRVEGAGAGSGAVQVGPEFLDQLAFWPRRPEIAHVSDDDPAVLLDAADTWYHGHSASALTHGDLRENAVAAAAALRAEGATQRVVVFPCTGRSYGLGTVLLAGACLGAAGPPCPIPRQPAAPQGAQCHRRVRVRSS